MPNSPSPPPPPFTFTSGNFDYPQATSSPSPPALRRVPTHVALDRILRRHQERERRRQTNTQTEQDLTEQVPLITRAQRWEMLRNSRAPLPPHAERLHGDELLRRSREILTEQRSLLAAASMIEIDIPHGLPDGRRSRSPTSEMDELSRQSKRRKLAHDGTSIPEYDGFKYGYKGQVVPGRLKMNVMSCDGGEYERHSSERLYKVQNVLSNDKSVYCSENSRCNLLLEHQGGTPFCLERLVIRAPDRGFTAPVQEGLVFVSLSSEELLSKTASYKIDYNPHSPVVSPSPSSSDDQLLSLHEALVDPQISANSRQDTENHADRRRLRGRRYRPRPNSQSARTRSTQVPPVVAEAHDYESNSDNCPYYVEDGDPIAGISAPTPPPFTITTEDEQEDSDGEQTLPAPAIMADRLRRESRWRPETDDEDEDGDDPQTRMPLLRRADALDTWENFRERRWRNNRQANPIRATRLRTPSRIEPDDDDAGGSMASIQPHARFFIAKNKNKITIKFNPALSGKFILLKLWSPTSDGNIDIESVQLYGYSGPRFFPAVQAR
ncbi:unnamed protein product [Periconia digitata]|uniref:Uncharacterized protein n=1 Tax=Periconia digitata TaxID=1303443 RepID=A0A9W4XQ79_9PLEO|nr:unnamed protein product [Periconia digitata]